MSEFWISHNKVSLVEGRKRDARMVRKATLEEMNKSLIFVHLRSKESAKIPIWKLQKKKMIHFSQATRYDPRPTS